MLLLNATGPHAMTTYLVRNGIIVIIDQFVLLDNVSTQGAFFSDSDSSFRKSARYELLGWLSHLYTCE